ncbi:hypothetical protein IL306_004328 [Fusarium sp. DS 682]|nr:hypothetical protein IL306_004328 [Fusarium sp. DS 682]
MDKPIVLWVDAICINQRDNQEKSQQVQLLPLIFQRSECTYAFLGKDPQQDAAVVMLLQVLVHQQLIDDENMTWPKKLPKCPKDWKETGIAPRDHPVWAGLIELLNHAWFRRVWIVQEAVASPIVKFVCDKYIIRWEDMAQALWYLVKDGVLSHDVLDALQPFRILNDLRAWDERQTRWSILLLLEVFRGLQSTLKRDRYYALLGIACDGNLPDFEPDYTSPFEDVVISFARALVSQGMGIQLLHRAGISTQPDRFPSWIPDWTVQRPPSLNESLSRGVQYNACGSDKNVRVECRNKDELLVTGYNIDKIAQITKSANTIDSWRQYFAEIDNMVDSLHCSSTLKGFYKWKVPVAGSNHGKSANSDYLNLLDSYKAFQKFMKKMKWKKGYKLTDIFDSPPPEDLETAREDNLTQRSRSYAELLIGSLEGWRFAITENNRCGIVPPNAQVGDDVLILGGGKVPFLFRESSERERAYQLVGECYVEGIMQGEEIEEDESKKRKMVGLIVH